ncbi:MAG: sulfur oxidase [Methanomicrobiales archaeon HGW-Methanomicrobiales-1]|jgi:tRNA 2-thiouridine synthesizing protein C|nr:MAG: sulfur oxidase [Methanomicrobiales archaeon HGW-Methanomicrobiales-1]
MNAHFFFLSGRVPVERLSWIEECLKFFFVQLYPDTLMHRKTTESPVFSFFLTGDALYSLGDPETLQVWNIILSFSPVRIVCDRQELDLRGIGIGPLRMKFPDQVIDTNSPGADGKPSFWKDLAMAARQNKPPLPGTIGWFQTGSPYMHRSAWHGLSFLSSAVGERLSAELYAYLDGIHLGHHGQRPTDAENIGKGLTDLSEKAVAAGLGFLAIASSRCATARGYSTWDDGQGSVISTCTIKPFKIRELDLMIERFRQTHTILSSDAGSFHFRKQNAPLSFDRTEKNNTAPPVTILVTQSPYSTELASGAVAFASACAHAGILTRVVFMEDGVYALTGTHRVPANSEVFNLQDVINAVAGSNNLHFFAFTPSFQKRGITKDKSLNAVLDIGYPGLGKIFFYPPGNVRAGHQRLLVF